MYKKIEEAYEKSLGEIKRFYDNIRNQEKVTKAVSKVIKAIKKGHKKSSWVNIAVLITNILGFAVYCAVSPVIAEYQRLKRMVKFLHKSGGKFWSFCQKYFDPIMKVIGFLCAVF